MQYLGSGFEKVGDLEMIQRGPLLKESVTLYEESSVFSVLGRSDFVRFWVLPGSGVLS